MGWPRWVYDEGTDPDPRFTLANERTFLAWIRTSIAFMAAGVAIDALPVPYSTSVKSALSAVLVATGILASVMAWLRWALTERADAPRRTPALGRGAPAARHRRDGVRSGAARREPVMTSPADPAAARTALAWQRTALSILAAALLLVRLSEGWSRLLSAGDGARRRAGDRVGRVGLAVRRARPAPASRPLRRGGRGVDPLGWRCLALVTTGAFR